MSKSDCPDNIEETVQRTGVDEEDAANGAGRLPDWLKQRVHTLTGWKLSRRDFDSCKNNRNPDGREKTRCGLHLRFLALIAHLLRVSQAMGETRAVVDHLSRLRSVLARCQTADWRVEQQKREIHFVTDSLLNEFANMQRKHPKGPLDNVFERMECFFNHRIPECLATTKAMITEIEDLVIQVSKTEKSGEILISDSLLDAIEQHAEKLKQIEQLRQNEIQEAMTDGIVCNPQDLERTVTNVITSLGDGRRTRLAVWASGRGRE